RGASRGTLTAFLMIAPLLSPHTIALTLAMLGWPFALARVLLPIGFTWALGTWLDRSSPHSPTLSETASTPACCSGNNACAAPASTRSFRTYLTGSAAPLVPYYLGGLFVVALLEPILKTEWMTAQASGPLAYGAALLVGIPLYVCDGGEVPLTAALLTMGVGPGPAFTFLLGSVGTCFATMAMAPKIIGWQATLIYITGTFLLALGGGLALSAWLAIL
ncbi:MAG: permease, partial [Verrucomicrobiia bacterium]